MDQIVFHRIKSGQIRLLKVSKSEGLKVRFSLEVHQLDSLPENGYIAVSYAWGRAEEQEYSQRVDGDEVQDDVEIQLHGPNGAISNVEVNRNLHDFLEHVGNSRFINRFYWIDALCINQQDVDEKSEQVNQMDKIYFSADLVVTWLGTTIGYDLTRVQRTIATIQTLARKLEAEGLNTHSALADISDVVSEETLTTLGLPLDMTMDHWMDLTLFFQRRWFRRVWTLQESAMAKRQIFIWGANLIDADSVRRCNALILQSPLQEKLIREAQTRYPTHETLKVLFTSTRDYAKTLLSSDISMLDQAPSRKIWIDPNATAPAKTASFLFSMLVSCRLLEASDPRDKVFALLGFLTKMTEKAGHEVLPINPDYSLSVEQAFVQAMTVVLTTTGSLNYLSQVQDRISSAAGNLPSWVADYTAPTSRSILATVVLHSPEMADTLNAATGIQSPSEGFRIDGNTLNTHSINVATVTHIGESHLEYFSHQIHRTVQLLLSAIDRSSPEAKQPESLENPVMAFQRTLLCYFRDLEQHVTRYVGGSTLQDSFHRFWKWLCISYIAKKWDEEKWSRSTSVSHEFEQLDTLARLDSTGSFPTVSEVIEECECLGLLENGYVDKDRDLVAEMTRDTAEIDSALRDTMHFRRTFLLSNGWIGLGSQEVRVGDTCRIISGGAKAPFILRQVLDSNNQESQKLIGEAYVKNMMLGCYAKDKTLSESSPRWERTRII